MSPDDVLPGDIFELRVEMDREHYAQFTLDIPAQQHLHRIAVESVPVSFDDGRYHQSEKWLLQADASGSYLIEGGSVLLDTGGEVVSIPIPVLELTVAAYGKVDESIEPAELPEDSTDTDNRIGYLFWVGSLFVSISVFVLLMKRHSEKSAVDDSVANSLLSLIADEIEKSEEPSDVLEKLIHDNEAGISNDLRERLIQFLYGGGGDKKSIADALRKEAGR